MESKTTREALLTRIDSLADIGRFGQNCLIFKVAGDSMTGAGILNGDLVYIDPTKEVTSGSIAVVRFTQRTLKRVFFQAGFVQLCSEHEDFPPYDIRHPETCEVIGLLVGVDRQL